MTGICNLMLIIFNPMRKKGYAVDTQYSKKHRWVAMRWNSEESEIVDSNKIQRTLEDCNYDKNSNPYRMNILGLPPVFDEETMFDWDWIMDASEREMEVLPDMPLVEALDCGAGGDSSIIARRRGNYIYPFKSRKTQESPELVAWAGAEIDNEEPDVFRVDVVGIGWAVAGDLQDRKGAVVESADSRRTADNPDRFENKRAEMYWDLRELFEKGLIKIPSDQRLMAQLGAMRYNINKRGKIQLLDKKALKKEIGHSPDEADALAMLFYYPDSLTSRRTPVYVHSTRSIGTWMAA